MPNREKLSKIYLQISTKIYGYVTPFVKPK